MIPETLKTKMVVEKAQDGFTLAELLVASAILALLVVLLLTMVNQTSKTWKSTSGKIEEFRGARDAFDTITRRMGQATLNTYLDYVTNSSGVPVSYGRQSELRFLSGTTTNILSSLALSNQPTMSVFFQAPNGFSTSSSAGYQHFLGALCGPMIGSKSVRFHCRWKYHGHDVLSGSVMTSITSRGSIM
jgi:uncharacterized protein (TIGR02599 family)